MTDRRSLGYLLRLRCRFNYIAFVYTKENICVCESM